MTIETKPAPSQIVDAICNDVRSRMPKLRLLEDLNEDPRPADIGPDISLPAIHMHIILEHLRFLEAAYRVAHLHRAPQKIEFAPPGDGWVLGYAGDTPHVSDHPWRVITRCDGGWCDEEGHIFDATAWIALPDPQPAPTGYRVPEGRIVIDTIVGSPIAGARFVVSVMLPDGQPDRAREPDLASDHADALKRAVKMADSLHLPIDDMSSARSANVVSLPTRGTLQ